MFLVIEGAAISCAAACYLAYLLRAVAAQRYKLYGTFLVIPVVSGRKGLGDLLYGVCV